MCIPDNSLDPPLDDGYDVSDFQRAGNPKPTQIDWGGVPIKGLEQIPTNTTVYHQSSNSFTVGVNNSTSDGNSGTTDRPRAELSLLNGTSQISSTSYTLQVNGRSVDNKVAHVTQIKGKGDKMPALTVSVGNPKGNKSDNGLFAVMTKSGKTQWVNKDGGLSTTFDPKKAVPANQANKVDIGFPSKDKATLKINGKTVTTVSGVGGDNLKFGAYGGQVN